MIIIGFLPPSSRHTFFRLHAAAWAMALPTFVDPVNEIILMLTQALTNGIAIAGHDIEHPVRNKSEWS